MLATALVRVRALALLCGIALAVRAQPVAALDEPTATLTAPELESEPATAKDERAERDPVAGVWKGLARGNGRVLPEHGVPASLWLERAADGGVTGRLSVQGIDEIPVRGTWDGATRALALSGAFNGVPFGLKATVADEALTGALTSFLARVDVEARRIATEVLPAPVPPDRVVDPRSVPPEDWIADLRFLAGYLPQVHANAFHRRSIEEWRAAVAELEARLPELDGTQSAVAIAQLVALVGDAHTGVPVGGLPGFDGLPVRFEWLADGLCVTEVDARWSAALGGRVTRLAGRPVAEVTAAVATVFAAENDAWRRMGVVGLLPAARLLVGLDLLDSAEGLPLEVVTIDGRALEVVIENAGAGERVRRPDPARERLPLWQTRRGESYWLEPLPAEGAVYVAYNRCVEDAGRPMRDFLREALAALDEHDGRRLVLDLRTNGGGNSSVLADHLDLLVLHPRLARRGALAVLVGPRTYSSAMLNAVQLRDRGAVLVGEPTGGKPNSYGEVRRFRLPRSGLTVLYSTKHFRLVPDDPPTVTPDVLVETGWADWLEGRDPVLERALALELGPEPGR